MSGSMDPPPPRHLERLYSTASYNTVQTLQTIELQVVDMERQAKEYEALLSGPAEEIPAGTRNKLAQLHGDTNKLLATKLDAILTGDLNSGKDDARATRKKLTAQMEALIEKVEALVKKHDQLVKK